MLPTSVQLHLKGTITTDGTRLDIVHVGQQAYTGGMGGPYLASIPCVRLPFLPHTLYVREASVRLA